MKLVVTTTKAQELKSLGYKFLGASISTTFGENDLLCIWSDYNRPYIIKWKGRLLRNSDKTNFKAFLKTL